MCATQEITINNMKGVLDMYKSDTEEIHTINQDIQEHIDSYHKEPESFALYPEHSTSNLNKIANITIDSDITTPQKKEWERLE